MSIIMPIASSWFVREETPSEVQRKKQCYVCDRYFGTKRELIAHRKLNHNEVIVFEIFREDRRTFAFVNSWKIANFDDLFFSENDQSQLPGSSLDSNRSPRLKKRIKHNVTKLQVSMRSRFMLNRELKISSAK